MKYEVRHPANIFLYGNFVELEWVDPKAVPPPHAKDCCCIGCAPRQPNDELYAKLKRNDDYWRR